MHTPHWTDLQLSDSGTWSYHHGEETFASGTAAFARLLKRLRERHLARRRLDRTTFPAQAICRKCCRSRKGGVNAVLRACRWCLMKEGSLRLFKTAQVVFAHKTTPAICSYGQHAKTSLHGEAVCETCQRCRQCGQVASDVDDYIRWCQPCFESMSDELRAELLIPLLSVLEHRRITGALDSDLEWSDEFDRKRG